MPFVLAFNLILSLALQTLESRVSVGKSRYFRARLEAVIIGSFLKDVCPYRGILGATTG